MASYGKTAENTISSYQSLTENQSSSACCQRSAYVFQCFQKPWRTSNRTRFTTVGDSCFTSLLPFPRNMCLMSMQILRLSSIHVYKVFVA